LYLAVIGRRRQSGAIAVSSALLVAAGVRGQPQTGVDTPPAAATPACPEGMALVDRRFCIDRWEAITLLASGSPHSPYHSPGTAAVRAASQPGHVPQAHISMKQADAACQRAGKRLCTTAEWVDACRGTSAPKRTFPYGIREQLRACNTEHNGHPQLVLLEGRRKTDSLALNDPRLNQLGGTVAPGGAFPGCVTPDGVADLHGNLLEWTRGERPLLMGGYYVDARENGKGCSYVTMLHDADYHDFTTGFRCCQPPPATAAPLSSEPRDPPGFRSFTHPGAPLPPLPKPPPYEPESAACPTDMALVEGDRCAVPVQECLRWIEPPGKPQRACGEFAPSRCGGARRKMRYCIDRHEHTPAGYQLPLVHVSWNEAQRICRAMDKRLCLEDEWEFACEGPEALPYPYGTLRDGAACNHDVAGELFTPRGKLVDRRVRADSLPRCESPFGVFNLVGNVDEWTTRAGKQPPWRSVLRGGWWLTGRNRCRAATESHNEIYAGPQSGFRCCKAARR
jgi:formylglycine-generating enzyme